MQRLDKLLADADVASRSALKSVIRSGRVTVDGAVVKDPSRKVEEDAVLAVTSTKDKDPTVMELVPEGMRKMDLAPVGRLDKDTEGLLLMTNDGVLAHKLTSPKAKVSKVYYVEHEGIATQEDVAAFQKGIVLKDGEACMPAILRPMGPGKSEVVLGEGKYHQVKRMMASRSLSVTYLKRVKEGGLGLGNLEKGQMRELSAEEEALLFQA